MQNHSEGTAPRRLRPFHALWYLQDARNWNEALPVGNGRLGAMCHGGTLSDRLSLSEDTLWTGHPRDTSNPQARQHLERVRQLIFAGRFREAQDIVEHHMEGQGCQMFQTAGDLLVTRLTSPVKGARRWDDPPEPVPASPTPLWFGVGDEPSREADRDPAAKDVLRGLDFDGAVAFQSFRAGDVALERRVAVSAVHQVLGWHQEATGGTSDLLVRFACPLPHRIRLDTRAALEAGQGPLLVLEGQCPDSAADNWKHRDAFPAVPWNEGGRGVRFVNLLKVDTDGFAGPGADGESIEIRHATRVTLWVAVESTFRGFDAMPGTDTGDALARARMRVEEAARAGWEAVEEAHAAEHRSLYRRMELTLGDASDPGAAMPTDRRLEACAKAYHEGKPHHDPGLAATLFHYGRYLLAASSRPGTQAANLQGIWNNQILPPWGSEYTTNINTQMNYWPAEACNLADCARPLFALVDELGHTGKAIATAHYGTRGSCAHHNVDIWRNAGPVDGDASWALWPMAHAWLARHLWEHWLHTGDAGFLARSAWPALKAAAEFLLDWLVPTPEGTLGTCPSTSPENVFLTPEGKKAAVCHSSTMDLCIIRETLEACRSARKEMEARKSGSSASPGLEERIAHALEHLHPVGTTPDGRLSEWSHNPAESEPGHRHISHLYGVHPAWLWEDRPDLVAAARKSLEFRLAHGGGHTGWSCAWLVNQWARLKDGREAGKYVETLLARSAYPNLLDAHPPFQIDGNFGVAAGMAEMLVQSHRNVVEILPACSPEWTEGSLKGLRARGGLEIDLAWKDGTLTALEIRDVAVEAPKARKVRLGLPGEGIREVELPRHGSLRVR